MNEQSQTNLMHHVGLGERQRLADKSRYSLPQGVVPSLDMSRLPRVFTTSSVLVIRDDLLIGLPEIRVAMPGPIDCRNRFPQLAVEAGSFRSGSIKVSFKGGSAASFFGARN